MEVEEEKTSSYLHESSTTVTNERLLENDSSNGEELQKEASKSNTQEEEEEPSVTVPKLDDPKPLVAVAVAVAVAVGGVAEEKEVIAECSNPELRGSGDSIVVESANATEGEKHGDEGVVKDEIPTGSVVAAECGGSELTNSRKDDGAEDNGVVVVEGNVNNGGVDTNTNGGKGEMETVEVVEEGVGVDVVVVPVADDGEREEVMEDAKNDDGVDTQKENIEIVQGDEAITEGQDDVQEGVVAEVVKEKGIVPDEEEAVGVEENNEEEASMAEEEKADGVTENDEETEEEATMDEEEKVPDADIVMETDSPARIKGRPRKRKRGGKQSKPTPKPKAVCRKMIEEDVCFICFDGGDLVLCDHKNCPKAYHPSCVNRDEAFFKTKGRWNCGWHLCSICEKKAEYMCYTCTFSLCKACIKTNVILCIREKEKKGFCEACMKTVILIEKDSQENQGNIDFNDKSSWEYLFKDYWTDLKAKLDLSLAEVLEAKNAWKGSEPSVKQESPAAQSDLKDDGGSGSENPSENPEPRLTRRRKANKCKNEEENVNTVAATVVSKETKNTEWASKELLDFVTHMRNGNESIISQFDVQALLLEYIKTNNLRDSRRKSQIICDTRLQRLFGKPRVGHFEMLKLLESHFLIKEDAQIDDIQGNVVDTDDEANEILAKDGKDRKRKTRKKGDREPQSNREDYAAIDIHNISLIYLRRKLVENLLDDSETFRSKVVGTFVRIRISGANHKHDIYRLVHVTGTTKAAQYTVGKKKTDTMLEILNLDKTESISIDTISNQEFTEDECKRLRQSIKCGLINRLIVGDILDKAMELQVARVNDWLETEVMRLSHLRDRASDLGRKKELRECVEKLQVLKTPEERARRLEEFPVINVDSTMDPNYVSEDDTDTDAKKLDTYSSSAGSRLSKRREYPLKESWSGTGSPRSSGKNYEFTRNLSNKSFSIKVEDTSTSAPPKLHNENLQPPSILKKPRNSANEEKDNSENEMKKMWHYKDPFDIIQGPFSMVQLCKWSNNKYFPVDLKIWKKNEKEVEGILLTDALEGRFTTKVDMANLPSPTPNRSVTGLDQVGLYVGPGGTEGLQSPPPSSAQLVQSVGGQSLPIGPNGWNGGAPQNPQLSHRGGTWVLQVGSIPAPRAQGVAPNQGWVPTQGPRVGTAGNTNMGWARTGNQGAANQGWVRNGSDNRSVYSQGSGSGFGGNRRHWSNDNRDH